MKETIIISLGGSLIIPDDIDIDFLEDFKRLIVTHTGQGKKFVIICGGGKINKKYNEAAKKISTPTDENLDWIGIAALKLNAELIRVIFAENANIKVVENLSNKFSFENSIVIGSACEPGKSSDWDATEAAKTIGAKKIINLSNTDYVYDSDTKKNPDAKKIEKISWIEYRKLIPEEWKGKYVFFWGTIYRNSGGYLNVRYLYWGGDSWSWDYDWLDDDFHGHNPATLSASI